MLQLFQAEWCPHSAAVRERLTELGVPFVARQVPADPDERQEIPVLVLDDGSRIAGEDEIVGYLERTYPERRDADVHRRKAEEHAG